MELIINGVNQKVSLSNKIGEGSEGKVYLSNNNTYKIYYPSALYDGFGFKEKHHIYLQSINTEQIILPTDLIYSKFYRYIGYTAPYIKCKKIRLIDIDKGNFVENLKTLENDIKVLSNNQILMADVKYYNFIYNGVMYIIDPGRYRTKFDETKEELYKQNIEQYQKLILYLIEKEMYVSDLGPSKIEKTMNIIKKEVCTELSKYFKEDMKRYDTLREYVKHKH